MTNGIAVVEHLRANSNLVLALPAGAMGIGHSRVLPKTPEPYLVVLGGEGGDPAYSLGNELAFGRDTVCVMVSSRSTESESEQQIAKRILDLVYAALQNQLNLSYVTQSNGRVLNLRYIGSAKSSIEVVSEDEVIFHAGHRYEIHTAPS